MKFHENMVPPYWALCFQELQQGCNLLNQTNNHVIKKGYRAAISTFHHDIKDPFCYLKCARVDPLLILDIGHPTFNNIQSL